MAERREALKIIGAIGATCAFPFASDELYAQHTSHLAAAQPAALPAKPSFFRGAEFDTVSALTNLIIPTTDTPGAIAAGVPLYIDYVVGRNPEAQKLYRNGLRWLDARAKRSYNKKFTALEQPQQIAILTPLCEAADKLEEGSGKKPPLEIAFFRAVKNMTSDGFFTSKPGLIDTLHYRGNTVLPEFPECVHEH